MVTLDARTSDAVEGVLTRPSGTLGRRRPRPSSVFTHSHRYTAFGIYTVSVTVVNDPSPED
ncbi:MAG: hypothetical protein CM15mP79_1150 [Methanobacteriota archaeon]|nr:MAG: hypothetical protein CM15mP79_1150 [Euryarchaeota archaeon]